VWLLLPSYSYDIYSKENFPDRDIAANQLAMLWAAVGNTMPGYQRLLLPLMLLSLVMMMMMLLLLSTHRECVFYTGTFWVVYRLLSHPEALLAVQEELEIVLKNKVVDGMLYIYI
jgi:hypothetical protein